MGIDAPSDPPARPVGLAQLPHLTADEMAVLLHGLDRMLPGRGFGDRLPSFLPDELERVAWSLSTALREGMIAAERVAGA